MLIRKKTLPTVAGGLMNPAFVYIPAAKTDIRRRFDSVRCTLAGGAQKPATNKGGAAA